jgi:c-di-GMP-binding flagellar brake protein YcgR
METVKEKRADERRRLLRHFGVSFSSYYIDVYDIETGELMGRLEDISGSGMRLFSGHRIFPDQVYSFRMVLPSENEEDTEIRFKARSVWCSHEPDSPFFHIGFSFTNISGWDSRILQDTSF